MTKSEIDYTIDQWVSKLPVGSGRRYYSKPSPETDDELQYIVRQTTIVNGLPIAHQRDFITETLSAPDATRNTDKDFHRLTQLLETFDKEFQNKLESKKANAK